MSVFIALMTLINFFLILFGPRPISFGMYHDTEKTGCDSRTGSIVHVMTPSFEADTVQVSWSNCSRRDITHFLEYKLFENLPAN